MKKIAIVTTMWSSINYWIKPFLNDYHDNGIDVTIICNMDEKFEESLKAEFPFVHTFAVAFPRGINFSDSLKSIKTLTDYFKKNSFDMVQYSTPNASMYAAIAAKKAKIPVRLYCQWGMVYVTMKGIKRFIFEQIERNNCRYSTYIEPDSKGNLDFCREKGFYDEKKSEVIWNGGAKGIDLSRFDFAKKDEYRAEIREKYNLGFSPVIGFVGRLGKEKGCNELFTAYKRLKDTKYPDLKLLFIGPIEKEDTINPDLLEYFENCNDIIKTGRIYDVERYISAMDVFVLPSYREGFGMGVVEASSMGVPVVVSKYPGPSSAMEDGVTGFAHDIGDTEKIISDIDTLLSDAELCKKMGEAGIKFAKDNFDITEYRKKYIENRLKLLRGDENV